jgi:hypothetical protein
VGARDGKILLPYIIEYVIEFRHIETVVAG